MKKYIGYYHKDVLPIKKGDVVTIRKGTRIQSTSPSGSRIAGRTYKIKVNHILSGAGLGLGGNTSTINPAVCWPGSGGYWNDVDINDIPEAQPDYDAAFAKVKGVLKEAAVSQHQGDLMTQLRQLVDIANLSGLNDAADFVLEEIRKIEED